MAFHVHHEGVGGPVVVIIAKGRAAADDGRGEGPERFVLATFGQWAGGKSPGGDDMSNFNSGMLIAQN